MDRLDDVQEVSGLSQGLSKFAFISCWTEIEDDNIALWNMYTPNMQGVKVSLPKRPFKQHTFRKGHYGDALEINIPNDMTSYLPLEELINDKYLVLPMFDVQKTNIKSSGSFYKAVKYVENPENYYEKLQKYDFTNATWEVSRIFDLGLYKKKVWDFQKESRFTLYCIPLLPSNHQLLKGDAKQKYGFIGQTLFGDKSAFELDLAYPDHIDVPLDEAILNNIVVTLGPNCGLSSLIIVEALLKQYTTQYTLKESKLTGFIRSRSS